MATKIILNSGTEYVVHESIAEMDALEPVLGNYIELHIVGDGIVQVEKSRIDSRQAV